LTKKFKTTKELIDILYTKGISIKDETNAKHLIDKYSYYSIVNTYKWIFKIDDNYKNNASFEEIFAMYKFDKNLKIIMLKYILEIEAIIKTKIANLFAEKYGLEDYLNLNNFDLKEDNSNLEHVEKIIAEIKNEINKGNGKHDAITHYMSKYGFVPPWVVTKVLSLGTISKLYGLMKQQDRQEISKQFYLSDRILKNILGNLTAVRNISAHDDRLYSYRSTFYIRLDKTKKSPKKVLHTNLFIIIKSLELLLEENQALEMKKLITNELNVLKSNLTSITIDEVLRVMGFDKEYYIV
jgi:abortive infection bacteriophage resistance protein